MIATFIGFCLFFGAPVAWYRFKVDAVISLVLFFWGIGILTR
jgi:hypothetical protein